MNEDLIKKIFPTPEMQEDFLTYQKLSKADRDAFLAEKQQQFATEPSYIHKQRIEDAIKAGKNAVDELQELYILKQLQNVSPFISLSEISKTYFGKSRG